MKAIVTGAAGFIGSTIVDKFISEGFDTIAVDNLSAGLKDNVNPKATFVELDIRDFSGLRQIATDCDYFIHCAAAMPIVRPPFEDTVEHEEINVIGTMQCLKALEGSSVKKFLYASSCATYGQSKNLPITEGEAVDLLSRPYTIQKFCGEQFSLLLGQRYGIPVVSLRLFANYGPRSLQNTKTANTYSPVIGIFLQQKLDKRPLTITGDGSQSRDFINVEDTARIFYEVALSEEIKDDIFNVCSGRRITIQELANIISPDQTYIERTYGEVEHIHGDNSKLRKFGISPKITLEEGIANLEEYLESVR